MQKLMMRTMLVYAAVFLLTGLLSAAPNSAPMHPTAAPSLSPRTVVLPLSQGPYLLGAKAASYWTPKAADLRRLEAVLPPSITGYCRQYIGIVQGGKRLIYINGFSAVAASEMDKSNFDWHKKAVFVNDGGTGFFEATYDPKTRKFSGPEFHGLG